MGAAEAVDGTLKGPADGVNVGSECNAPIDLGVDSKEMANDAFAVLVVSCPGVAEHDVSRNGANPIINAEAGLDPSVERQENRVLWELRYAFG